MSFQVGDRVRDLHVARSCQTARGTILDTDGGRLLVTCNKCSSPYHYAPPSPSCPSCGGGGVRTFAEMERSVRVAGGIVAVRWDMTRAPCAVYATSIEAVSAVDRLAELVP